MYIVKERYIEIGRYQHFTTALKFVTSANHSIYNSDTCDASYENGRWVWCSGLTENQEKQLSNKQNRRYLELNRQETHNIGPDPYTDSELIDGVFDEPI